MHVAQNAFHSIPTHPPCEGFASAVHTEVILDSPSAPVPAFWLDDLEQASVSHLDRLSQAYLAPRGEILASGSGDGNIKLWNLTTGKAIRTLTGHADRVRTVVFSPDGKRWPRAAGTGPFACGIRRPARKSAC
jgi:WD40 repeat protein